MIVLAVGTVLLLVFIALLFKGSKYDYMLDPLDGDDFPLKTLYSAGLAVQDYKFGRLRGKIGDKLRQDCALIYTRQFSEYYARIIWAQMFSFALFFPAVTFVAAGLLSEDMTLLCLLTGVGMCLLSAYYFYNHTGEKVKERREECEKEFPNAISKLALIVNSGVILHEAWEMVAYGKNAVFYDMMKRSCEEMGNGKSDIDAIHDFGVRTNSDDIKKFASALIQSIERGGGDLPQFLVNQSSELWANRRQVMLQKGEAASSALLMPIALMFFGVMMIVIAAAMQSFSL